ncbi:MAG: hypothetical protein HY914_20670 [Desulfomonile tiedjei]|nr:hypothetical protein [Desulfomonile tiedjei]
MTKRSIGPGDDVEAWCTRCRMNLNHRVIAVVGAEIQRVHCLTCGGDHKYHPTKGGQTPRSETRAIKVPSGSSTPRPRKSGDKGASKAFGEWSTFMRDMPDGTIPRAYNVSEAYAIAEYIEHREFGTGRVLSVLGAERIEVIFKDGRKVMVCNRKKAPA